MKYNLELIRLIAVILITFTHTKHNFESGSFYYLFEVIPKYGTLMLSMISGYLYWTISRNNKNLFSNKVKSLLIPYLIANIIVMIPIVTLYYAFDYNVLHRLNFDYKLISDGIFALYHTPINPPTYFIRDIFIVFTLIELIKNKNLKMLFILIPLLIFGRLFIRIDIVVLFTTGILIAEFKNKINTYLLFGISIILSVLSLLFLPAYSKYAIAFLIFISLVDINIKFYKTGAFSYLLHLYHAPIILMTFPIIEKYILNPYLSVITQLVIVMLCITGIFIATRKVKSLRIMTGGR